MGTEEQTTTTVPTTTTGAIATTTTMLSGGCDQSFEKYCGPRSEFDRHTCKCVPQCPATFAPTPSPPTAPDCDCKPKQHFLHTHLQLMTHMCCLFDESTCGKESSVQGFVYAERCTWSKSCNCKAVCRVAGGGEGDS